jgi:hypothetical protein
LTSARFVQITTKLTSLTPSNIAAVVAPRVLATYRESMSHSPRVHHVVAELMRSELPLSLFGVIFSDIIEIFTETYSTKRKYRNTKFLQRLTQEVRLNEFFIQRVRLLASTLEQQEADILGAHIIHRIIEYFYSESEVNTFTDDTPLTSPKPSGECLVGGWALRSSRQFFTAWLDRAAEDKILLLRYAIGIVDALSVPFGDVHRVAMSVADAHFRQLNAGGLRLPVSGLLILFADVHRKFNSMMSATSVATKRHVAIMHAEREIINHVQFRLIFTSLCDELKLVAPPEIKMQCAIDFTYEHVMRKWLHVREKE